MAAQSARAALTEQQSRAVFQREVSVVLSSGAGCGKTHVLTQRYLSHLREDGAQVSQVVAITFTERAARQMRERIREAIVNHLKAAEGESEVERWSHHLRGLETAQISTIHAFCSKLLSQHAVEAGLDPRFDVLDGYLASNLESEALTACLQRLLVADDQAGKDLSQLILDYGWKPTVHAVQHLMGQWDGPKWSRWLERTPEDVAAEWLGSVRQQLLQRHIGYLVAAHPKIARCLWLLRTTPCQGPRMAVNVARLLEETPRLAEAADLEATVKELTEAAKVGPERAKAWPTEEAYEAIKEAFEGFRRELPAQLALFRETPEGVDRAVAAGQRFLRVAAEGVRAYQQLKRRNAVVDFQDLLVLARDLLRDHPPVRERLQGRFRFLLIDELQDTDPVQMELVEHLCGAGLTEGKLFAVGDHSQSIYRFRNADVHLFQELKRRMSLEGRLGLTLNFRSQPAILDFANALFGGESAPPSDPSIRGLTPPARPSGLEDYDPLQAHHGQVNPGACVEFLWAPRETGENVTKARLREADWIARRIAAMVNEREELVADRSGGVARLQAVRPGNVVLLFRAMSNVELYEAALRNYGLDYYLVGGRAFFAQQEIYDLLNLLRALENPQDVVCLAGTLRSPFCCLSDEALFLLGRHKEGIWAGLHDDATLGKLPADQRVRALRARRGLDRWRDLKDRLPIARLLGEVFADTGFDASTQFEFLGDRKLANLWKLLELARSFDRSGLFGMAEFIQRLGDLVRNQPREEQAATQPENADVVRLMTIHQAKGLEFPVVIIPDVGATVGNSRNPAAHWDARLGCVVRAPADEPPPYPEFGLRLWEAGEAIEDWREDLRTLYVACTRAQDYLILSAALTSNYSPTNAWMLQLAERFDLQRGHCLDPSMPEARRPQIRVTNPLSAPPLLPVMPTAALTPDTEAKENPLLPTLRRELPAGGRALAPGGVVTVTATDGALGDLRTDAFAEGAAQFDAEDGSDRSIWVWPREQVEAGPDSDDGKRDRLIRRVLERWDFTDPEGWRSSLQQAMQGQPKLAADEALWSDLEQVLGWFAGSETFGQLAAARSCRRDVEFLMNDPDGKGLAPVQGVIDCLWQDRKEAWHLLAFTTSREAPADRTKDWNTRKPALVLWALAVQQCLGVRAKTIGRYYFADSVCVSRGAARLPQKQLVRTLWGQR